MDRIERDGRQEAGCEAELLTSMHSRLQAQQQVGQASFSGSRHAGVRAAAVFPQVRLAGFGQRVAHLVVLSDQLLPGGQSLAALRTQSRRQHHNKHSNYEGVDFQLGFYSVQVLV